MRLLTLFSISVILGLTIHAVKGRPHASEAIKTGHSRQAEQDAKVTDTYPNIVPPPSKKLVSDFPIHQSCDKFQRMQLEAGLADLKRLLRSAIDHILTYGSESSVYKTYFGKASDPSVPLGIYTRLLNGDKSATLLRCDDPDRNCETQADWAGHWRGKNATGETVICPLSFKTRLPIEKACTNGFSLVRDNIGVYWATDLLHRSMHLPALTNDFILHVADAYDAQLSLARTNPKESVRNQHSLQSFAFEAYVRANVDKHGCIGDRSSTHSSDGHKGHHGH